jgi:hypothetical protein
MRDPADNKTGDLVPVERGRGRPRKPGALTNAQRQAAYRARQRGVTPGVTKKAPVSDGGMVMKVIYSERVP